MHAIVQFLSALVELGLYALIAAMSLVLFLRARWAWRAGPLGSPATSALPAAPPHVTVQLPLRNEAAMAEDALRSAAALDWPRDRLLIQVLDDSDDDTVAIVDRTAAELRAAGTTIEVLRRGERHGYKAGALAIGAQRARTDRFLVLDADFRPEPQLLGQLEAALGRRAFCQARWSFRNRDASALTRLQAGILDALFVVEQASLSARGAPVQFNGTAGLWRRDAVVRAAGGWDMSDDALTEDLDLSFRAYEAGERGATLPELAVSTELPLTMSAFRPQQMRWVRGAGLALRTLGRRALRRASAADARTVVAHLLRHARQPWFVAAALRLPIVALGWATPVLAPFVGPTMFLLALGAAVFHSAAARRRIDGDAAAGAKIAPLLLPLSMGLAPALAMAFVGGALGRRGRGFVRTAKLGDRAPPAWRPAIDAATLVTLGVAATAALAWACFWRAGDWIGLVASTFVAVSCAWAAL